MLPARKILVALSFDGPDDLPINWQVTDAAVNLARETRARLTLLHVERPTPPLEDAGAPPSAAVPQARRGLAWLQSRAPDIIDDAEAVISVEPVADVVTAFAREGRFDLILVGSHGRHGWQRVVRRSIAEAILRDAPVPVLVVPLAPAALAPPEHDATAAGRVDVLVHKGAP
jgi:nucleotide-binding universal stress UspA family protein